MAVTETIVFVHLNDGPAPAGRLVMTEEPRHSHATFAYGRRYLERPGRVSVDPVALPLHDPGEDRLFQTEEGFSLFNGVRDAAPDAWGRHRRASRLLTTISGGAPMSRPPIHPGEILADELDEIGVTANGLARQIDVPPNRISEIILGRRGVTRTG